MIRCIIEWLHSYHEQTLSGPIQIFNRYWKAYGRGKALLSSLYLHIAVVLLLVTSHYWLFEKWWEQPLAVIPNLLGFSLGGFAVFVGLSDEGFRAWLSTTANRQQTSAFLSVSSTFVHFIVVQTASLLLAILAKSLDFKYEWPDSLATVVCLGTVFFSGLGYLTFLYAITSMLAATMSLFRVVSWYQTYHAPRNNHDDA